MKSVLRLPGFCLILAGLNCMPFPVTNPEAVTSVFPWLEMSGGLVKLGVCAIGIGALLLATAAYAVTVTPSRRATSRAVTACCCFSVIVSIANSRYPMRAAACRMVDQAGRLWFLNRLPMPAQTIRDLVAVR